MNVGILIITHGNIGSVLLQSATNVLGVCPLSTTTISAAPGCNPEHVLASAKQAAQEMDCGDGVLVLTDMYGATPSNIATELLNPSRVLVSGINLPMLVRVMNYPDLELNDLAEKAISGGQEGILALTARGD